MNKDLLLNAVVGIICSLLIIGLGVAIETEREQEQWLKQGIKQYPECAIATRNADVCIKLKTLAEEE